MLFILPCGQRNAASRSDTRRWQSGARCPTKHGMAMPAGRRSCKSLYYNRFGRFPRRVPVVRRATDRYSLIVIRYAAAAEEYSTRLPCVLTRQRRRRAPPSLHSYTSKVVACHPAAASDACIHRRRAPDAGRGGAPRSRSPTGRETHDISKRRDHGRALDGARRSSRGARTPAADRVRRAACDRHIPPARRARGAHSPGHCTGPRGVPPAGRRGGPGMA